MRALFLLLVLSFFAKCSREPAAAPPVQTPDLSPPRDLFPFGGKWVEETIPSKMYDSVVSALTLKAESEIEVFTGGRVFPKLTIGCASAAKVNGGMLSVGIITGFPVATNTRKGLPDGADIAIRLDAGEIVTDRWFSTEDNLMLMTVGSVPMVLSIAKSETMLIEFTPLKSKPVVASFDTRGLRYHLKLLAACDNKP